MDASFTQAKPNTRQVQVQFGDTLQRIALRELGDAAKWLDLVVINKLKPPYIVNTKAEAADGVLVAGESIAVPSPVQVATVSTDPDAVFLRDLKLDNGLLSAEAGDLTVAGGLDNLKQALLIRITTAKRELAFHPDYGCWVSSLIGTGNGPAHSQVAAFYVESALKQDERVAAIPSCTASVEGDSIRIDATVNPITGRTLDLQAVL